MKKQLKYSQTTEKEMKQRKEMSECFMEIIIFVRLFKSILSGNPSKEH